MTHLHFYCNPPADAVARFREKGRQTKREVVNKGKRWIMKRSAKRRNGRKCKIPTVIVHVSLIQLSLIETARRRVSHIFGYLHRESKRESSAPTRPQQLSVFLRVLYVLDGPHQFRGLPTGTESLPFIFSVIRLSQVRQLLNNLFQLCDSRKSHRLPAR